MRQKNPGNRFLSVNEPLAQRSHDDSLVPTFRLSPVDTGRMLLARIWPSQFKPCVRVFVSPVAGKVESHA
jgi:hypothetical protein